MFYPTVSKGTTKKSGTRGAEIRMTDDKVTMGFGLQLPGNDIKRLVVFGVRNKNRPEAVAITED